jgi:hypothetical protein
MTHFTEVLTLNRFAIYIFDYGSPTGLRMAVEHPERVTAIITQNGNAYVEGLSDAWSASAVTSMYSSTQHMLRES